MEILPHQLLLRLLHLQPTIVLQSLTEEHVLIALELQQLLSQQQPQHLLVLLLFALAEA